MLLHADKNHLHMVYFRLNEEMNNSPNRQHLYILLCHRLYKNKNACWYQFRQDCISLLLYFAHQQQYDVTFFAQNSTRHQSCDIEHYCSYCKLEMSVDSHDYKSIFDLHNYFQYNFLLLSGQVHMSLSLFLRSQLSLK